MDLSPDRVRAALEAHQPRTFSRATAPRRAAVAILLRYPDAASGPEVLLMRRSEHASDRWSGHVSFPGGREETHDPDLVSTAIRETREEVGVDLAESARLIGRSDAVRAVARGKVLPMSINPFVFFEERETAPTTSAEAADVFWLPLARAASGQLDERYPYRKGPLRLDLPAWRYEGRIIWGLTFDMLRNLLSVLRSDL